MSESLTQRWPEPGAPIGEHRDAIIEGIELTDKRIAGPEDDRLDITYTRLSGGGSALILADPGAGKTSFFDALAGKDVRTNVRRKTTHATLVGEVSPISGEQIKDPELSGMTPDDAIIYVDEVPHLPDTGDTHHWWTDDTITVGGQPLSLRRAVIMGTGNYEDGQRNNKLDAANLSRWGMLLVLGDNSFERAGEIQEAALAMSRNNEGFPILPPRDAREAIGSHLDTHFTPEATLFGGYITQLARDLNATGLVNRVNPNDMRLGQSLQNVAAANMFLKDEKGRKRKITPYEAAKVVALVLPAYVTLSRDAKTKISEASGDRVTSFEQAIALRRVLARTAARTLFKDSGAEKLSPSRQAAYEQFMELYSYANKGAIDGYDMDEALLAQTSSASNGNGNGAHSNGRSTTIGQFIRSALPRRG